MPCLESSRIGRPFCLLALVVFGLGMVACSWSRQTIPLTREAMAIRVPHQQRLVALALEQAVERLDFGAWKGLEFELEVNGVFPHSRQDLLDYMRTAVERRMREFGVKVARPLSAATWSPRVGPRVAQLGSAYAPTEFALGVSTPQPRQTAARAVATPGPRTKNRVVVGLSWGGIDTSQQHLVNKASAGVYAGVAGGVSVLTFLPTFILIAEDEDEAFIPPLIGLPMLMGWLALYPLLADLTYDTYTLYGRVRMMVSVMPEGSETKVMFADGESQVILDPTARTGYMVTGRPVMEHTVTKPEPTVIIEDRRRP